MIEDTVGTGHAARTAEREGMSDRGPRCWRCGRKLAIFLTRPWVILCGRCKARNQALR
jgi:hypothetical protein